MFLEMRDFDRPVSGAGGTFLVRALDFGVFSVDVSAWAAVAHRNASEQKITPVVAILMSLAQQGVCRTRTQTFAHCDHEHYKGELQYSATMIRPKLRTLSLAPAVDVDLEQQTGVLARHFTRQRRDCSIQIDVTCLLV
jgi:hypothetical protein